MQNGIRLQCEQPIPGKEPVIPAHHPRPSAADPLLILAMDHRSSFGRTLFSVVDDHPSDEQRTAMVAAKQLIYAGLTRAVAEMPIGHPGVLVDERYGQSVIDAARAADMVLAVPIERSGRDWFELEWGEQEWLAHVRRVAPDYVKVLVRDNPSFAPQARDEQFARLRVVSESLSEEGVPLLYELLVPASEQQLAAAGGDVGTYDRDIRPELVTQIIADNQQAGVEPAIWKVEGLETSAAATAVVAQARAGGRAGVDVIVLGRDAPADRLDHWLDVAAPIDGFVGFAIGRSIWEDAIRSRLANEIDDAVAAQQIATRYLGFARRWATETGDHEH
ncbi:MAG: 2-deoxy-5-keto-D-gluconate 6-phosphate aldolase domain-containing protein [Solirubrobacteraceae bacterium]